MSSLIDPTKPTATAATTASVRANFTAAKNEIEALQAVDLLKADLASPTFTGTLTAAALTASGAVTAQALLDISGVAAGQIKFPATQNPSANANTLDDYEELTWTPSLGGSATYAINSGSHTKIGRLVYVKGQIQVTAIGTGSTTTVSGLPFTAAEDGALLIFSTAGIATNVVSLVGKVIAGSTTFVILSRTAASAADASNAIFQNSAAISFAGYYNA